ncbi:hypothetical protein LTSEBAI_1243 [Salmonella enterica subsp. enterica serovar Baildon str. R6-199]|nr:hypothetical protein LTSEBAI_1243 [Salmonella enterica subsp. enterica serovar Baildon str. R6-199]
MPVQYGGENIFDIFAPAGGLQKIFLLLLAVSTVAALFSLYQVLTY